MMLAPLGQGSRPGMATRLSSTSARRARPALTWLDRPCSLTLSTGALEALKWLALLAMAADHVNSFWLQGRVGALQATGRLAFPLFAFVLGYNLARHEPPVVPRLIGRLLLAGLVAQPFFMWLTRSTWHLNVLFTFALAAVLLAGWSRAASRPGQVAWGVAGLAGGFFVEFGWYGVALVVAAQQACRRQTRGALLALGAALLALTLWLVSASGPVAWAGMAAWPAVLLVRQWAPAWRRRPGVFYVFYPLHLALLAALPLFLR